MANNITYTDKVALNQNPNIADINKVNDIDMNEIKNAVNETILTSLFGVATNTWVSQQGYSVGDVVIYDYKLYKNITGNNTQVAPDTDTTNWEENSMLETINNTVNVESNMYLSIPIGGGCDYYGSTPPKHFMFANGQAISRTTYATLFSIIGTTYGTGDGSTTFNLPNKTGNVGVGLDTTQTEFATLGKTGGSKYLQQHKHTWGGNSTRKFVGAEGFNSAAPGSGTNFPGVDDVVANTGNVLTGTGGVPDVGTSGNLQPYLVQNYIIRVE